MNRVGEWLEAAREHNRQVLGLAGLGEAGEKPFVRTIRVRSQITPEVAVDVASGASTEPGFGSWLLNFLKPEVEVETSYGPVRVAPYGRPTTNYFPLVAAGAAFAAWGAWKLLRRFSR